MISSINHSQLTTLKKVVPLKPILFQKSIFNNTQHIKNKILSNNFTTKPNQKLFYSTTQTTPNNDTSKYPK